MAEEIPEPVQKFIQSFYKAFLENDVQSLFNHYEVQFNKLTEAHFQKSSWPDPIRQVSPLVNDDQTFLIFYSEVYYRHIYAKLSPSLEDRTGSYNNYCNLFNTLLNSEDGPVAFELPEKWLWDIIDEFIYQFSQFSFYRSKLLKSKKNESSIRDLQYIEQNEDTWSSYSVLNALYSLVGRSRIVEQLKDQQINKSHNSPLEVTGEYGALPLYKNLGYYSMVGLLRIHTISGDFSLALKTMEFIDLDRKTFFSRVPACHFTTYYYVGFCYMMLHRYSDAIRIFSNILLYISRTKNINRSGQYDVFTKKSDQMYALLTILVGLAPQKLDDTLQNAVKEKFGEKYIKIQRSQPEEALAIYEELFKFGSPRFVSTSLHQNSNETMSMHLKIFMLKVKSIVFMPTLKSYLSLYSSIQVSKLAKFLDMEESELTSIVLTYKLNNRQLKWFSGDLLSGEYANVYDLDIELNEEANGKTLINVKETKTVRKFADWFMRNTIKNYAVQDSINGKVDESKYRKPAAVKK